MFACVDHFFGRMTGPAAAASAMARAAAAVSATISVGLSAVLFSFFLAAALLTCSQAAFAYDDRVALVIGNDAYPSSPLKNAQNDARAVAKTLSDLGFKVVIKTNADIVTMRTAVIDFTKVLDGTKAAVLYYAGHGIQYRNKNFMVPVDAKFTSEAEIVYNAVDIGQVLESMDDAKVPFKFVILDACRDNPFSTVFASTGLAKITKVPPGTTVAYAAAAGEVAADGDGANGLYTKHLLNELRNSDYQAGLMFQRVQTAVAQESGNKQLPELYSTPLPRGAFFFAERVGGQAVVQASAATPAGVSSDTHAGLDREFWTSIKDSKNIKDYRAYLDAFPTGTFAFLARNRIDDLKLSQAQVAAAPLSANASNAAPVLVSETGRPNADASSALSAATEAPKFETAKIEAAKIEAAKIENARAGARPDPLSATQVAQATPSAQKLPAQLGGSGESRRIERAPAFDAPPPASTAPVSATSAATPTFVPAQPAPVQAQQPAATAATAASTPIPAQVALLDQKTTLPPVPSVPKILAGLIDFPDGAKYNGEYKEDKDKTKILHGRGEYSSSDFRYNGEFKDGKKQGRGVYEWKNGMRFEGDFANDSPNGRGVWVFATGDKYEGEVKNSEITGKGVFITKSGDKIDGNFNNAKANGRVQYAFANGDKYDGDMAQGQMTGKGVYVTKLGDRTEANFVNGLAEGKGTYYFSTGDRYEGDFKAGSLTGQGTYYYSNGLRSDGEYVNGLLRGKGAFYFNDGSWFEGQFDDGLKRAKGIVIQKDGTKRNAEMVDGKVSIVP